MVQYWERLRSDLAIKSGSGSVSKHGCNSKPNGQFYLLCTLDLAQETDYMIIYTAHAHQVSRLHCLVVDPHILYPQFII